MTPILIICNIINTFVIFDFFNTIYTRKYNSKKLYILAIIAFYTIHVIVNIQHIVLLNMLFEIVIIQLAGHYLYKARGNPIIYNLLFALYLIFMDLMNFALLTTIFNLFNIEVTSPLLIFIFSVTLQYSTVFATYRLLILLFMPTGKPKLNSYQNTFFPLLAFFEIFTCYYVWGIKTPATDNILILLTLGFLLLDIYLVYLFLIVHKQTILQADIKLAKQQSQLLNNNARNIERQYLESRHIIHDIRGHLNTINALYVHGEALSAAKLSSQLEEELTKLNIGFFTTNSLLNILLYDKQCLAKNNNIKTDFIIQNDIDWSFMREIDMTSLFTNLLNNAIEACDKLDANKFLSTKQNHSGIGLSNIQSIINKYNGILAIKPESTYFAVEFYIINTNPALRQ